MDEQTGGCLTTAALVTAWNNGAHHPSGAGYGLKVRVEDRYRLFQRHWRNVILELEGVPDPIMVNVAKASFWSPVCRELISKEIGQWFLKNRWAPWPNSRPPRFLLTVVAENRFRVAPLKE